MYAIFDNGGKQYKVSEGDLVLIDRQNLDDGQTEITFDKVLMLGEGADAKVGTPWVDGATVTGQVLDEMKMPKIHGVKFIRRKGHLKRWGHRQRMLKVKVSKISG